MPSILLVVKHAQLDAHNAQVMVRIAQDTCTEEPRVFKTTAAGDERKLRGIPAIGRSVAGAIPGTAPHQSRIFLEP